MKVPKSEEELLDLLEEYGDREGTEAQLNQAQALLSAMFQYLEPIEAIHGVFSTPAGKEVLECLQP